MRIIPDGVIVEEMELLDSEGFPSREFVPCYNQTDTIEITDDEWNKIFGRFIADKVVMAGYAGVNEDTMIFQTHGGITFSQYLRELLELKAAAK